MKNTKRLISAACVLLCLLFSLCSCDIVSRIGEVVGISDFEKTDASEQADSVVGAMINEQGELILIYGDGRRQNVGVVATGEKGQDGEDGEDGADGEQGPRGEDGRDGIDGADGELIISTDNSSIAAASAKGLRSSVSIYCTFNSSAKQDAYYSAGSGVIYQLDRAEGDAFIITNYHVVYDAASSAENGISEDIRVYLYGSQIEDKAISATYVGGSLYYDIAVLRIEDSEVLRQSSAIAVDVANSDEVAVGKNAIAIGNPQGEGISASLGVVSVDSEYIDMTGADDKTAVTFRVMRVDTAVNSGNSGGGLFDDEGKLIGIVNAKIIDDKVENIGYAIPSNVAVAVADNIIYYCHGTEEENVQRALLGITIIVSDSRAVYDGETGYVTIEQTISVQEVSSGSLAEGLLAEGDILVEASLNGRTLSVTRQHTVIDMMLDARVGDTVTYVILRDGEELTVNMTITEDCITEY